MAQQSQVTSNFRLRRSFGKIKKIIDIPNLIEIQKRSYEEFLQADVPVEQRTDTGLQAVFKSVFPIKDFNETASLEFVSYELGQPKYDVEECHQRGMVALRRNNHTASAAKTRSGILIAKNALTFARSASASPARISE